MLLTHSAYHYGVVGNFYGRTSSKLSDRGVDFFKI